MRTKLVIALVVLSCACDEGGMTGPSPAGPVRISGRVLEFISGTPVAGATVLFGGVQAIADGAGAYVLTLPNVGDYLVSVNGGSLGSAKVAGPGYRGDLLTQVGNCVSRYGALTETGTMRPIRGATVTLTGRTVTSESDGWYRVDVNCPDTPPPFGGTTFITVSHPDYATRSQVVGRGVQGVRRLDLALERP